MANAYYTEMAEALTEICSDEYFGEPLVWTPAAGGAAVTGAGIVQREPPPLEQNEDGTAFDIYAEVTLLKSVFDGIVFGDKLSFPELHGGTVNIDWTVSDRPRCNDGASIQCRACHRVPVETSGQNHRRA